MQHAFHPRHPKRAFTLVELLLVITIIAIVLALILVAVQSLQNSARATACLANQRQLALANQTYATDNNGRLSSPRTDSSAIVGGGLPTLPNCWVDTNNTVCSGNRETDAALKKGSLWTYLGENSKVYVSPMDPTARRDFTDTSPPAGSRLVRAVVVSTTGAGDACTGGALFQDGPAVPA